MKWPSIFNSWFSTKGHLKWLSWIEPFLFPFFDVILKHAFPHYTYPGLLTRIQILWECFHYFFKPQLIAFMLTTFRCRLISRCFFWLQVFFYLAILVKLSYRVSPRVCTEVSMHFNFLQRKYPRAGWTGIVSSDRVGSLCINIITGSAISGLLWDTSFLWLFHCNSRISKKWWSWLTDSESEAALRLSMSLVLLNQKYNLEKGFPSSSLYQLSIKGFVLPGRVSTTVWSR